MKYNTLYNIVNNFKKYKYLTLVKRVRENIILLIFDNSDYIYLDITRGNSDIFSTTNNLELQVYQSSFDRSLKKLFTKVELQNISIVNSDKIIKIDILKTSSYKKELYSLQIELTSRFTNIIILNEQNIIINALRWVKNSSREIIQHQMLSNSINVPIFKYTKEKIPNIIKYLENRFETIQSNKLHSLKISKKLTLKNQLKKLEYKLSKLKDETKLLNDSGKLYTTANTMLCDIHNNPNNSKIINDMFKQAKKLKQKAKNINIEFTNLEEKVIFLKRKIILLDNITKLDKFEILFKKDKRNNKKEYKNQNIENIYFKGFKISYGKNSMGNIYLLKNSKANDIWMHLQGIPSTHIIIHTNKTNIPQDLLELGANLCVEYSVSETGDYIVDYTKRKFVKIVENSFTNYTNQKSIHMLKDSLKNPFL